MTSIVSWHVSFSLTCSTPKYITEKDEWFEYFSKIKESSAITMTFIPRFNWSYQNHQFWNISSYHCETVTKVIHSFFKSSITSNQLRTLLTILLALIYLFSSSLMWYVPSFVAILDSITDICMFPCLLILLLFVFELWNHTYHVENNSLLWLHDKTQTGFWSFTLRKKLIIT